MTAAATFTPPSPGAWELEQTHITKPPSLYLQSVFPGAMMRGFKAGTSHYGVLLDHLEVSVINGFVYYAPRPVGAPKGAKGPPPKAIFKLLTVLHPEIRRRIARSREVMDKKIWREDVARWTASSSRSLPANRSGWQPRTSSRPRTSSSPIMFAGRR